MHEGSAFADWRKSHGRSLLELPSGRASGCDHSLKGLLLEYVLQWASRLFHVGTSSWLNNLLCILHDLADEDSVSWICFNWLLHAAKALSLVQPSN